ncbi:hypothetical protein AVEN_193180-1 [Araneus ventricosus]|uniref:Uncharacterized protein n=1 Tax=Araneus ventricosus TaxID=182803 RepID=A0A4Y2B066_ARAVE|nr:hypothetical protein AVEN_193180-1 [Araneus ventricosus]
MKIALKCPKPKGVWGLGSCGISNLQTSSVKQYLVEEFEEQIIGYGSFQQWPPLSPDLTPMEFFLWDTSNSKRMRPLRQHCRTFNHALRMLVPTLCYTVRKMKFKQGSRCALQLTERRLNIEKECIL